MTKYDEIRANVGEVKEHLSAYVTRAEKGEKVVVCRRNRPVAQIVPVDAAAQAVNGTKLGSAPGSARTECNLTEPVMGDDWEALT